MMKFTRTSKKKPSADPPPSSSTSFSSGGIMGGSSAAGNTAATSFHPGSGNNNNQNQHFHRANNDRGNSGSSSGKILSSSSSSSSPTTSEAVYHHQSNSNSSKRSSSTSQHLQQNATSHHHHHHRPQKEPREQRRASSAVRSSSSSNRSSNNNNNIHSRMISSERHVHQGSGTPTGSTNHNNNNNLSTIQSPTRQQRQQQQHHQQQVQPQQQRQQQQAQPPQSSSQKHSGQGGGGGGGGGATRLGGVTASLGNVITSSLGNLAMHARSGSGGGANNTTMTRHSSSSTSTYQSQQQQQQSNIPLARRRDSTNSNSTAARYYKSSGQSVASIGSTSVFAPSIIGTSVRSVGGGGGGCPNDLLQPSSARLLRDLNKSAQSSLLSSLGTAAASRTFRSYKMMLPRYVPRMAMINMNDHGGVDGSGNDDDGNNNIETKGGVETDLELLGRTVHAVSSALTEPPRAGDKYMIYDVSFNPRGCVWDASVVVYDDNEEEEEEEGDDDDDGDNNDGEGGNSDRSRSRGNGNSKGRHGARKTRKSTKSADNMGEEDGRGTFTFPIRITCAEDEDDDEYYDEFEQGEQPQDGKGGKGASSKPRAKTYAVELSIIDDSVHNLRNAADHRDEIKNSVEWISYSIRRSMARSMFPQFPEGCRGRPFREVYQLNKKIKSGTFSTVCRGVHRVTGRQVAVKCILRKKIEPSVDAAVFEEVLIMSGLHHKYICPMIDYFEEERCHFVVMELEKGGDLCERLTEKGTYPEAEAKQVIRNMCEAMEFVHSKGFAHCDIKPRNYLLRNKRDDVDIRLADFGFAQHVHAPNSLTSQCGTPFFVAPEVINRKPYDQKVDMWSIGVTTYLLLSGDTPFNGKNRQQLFRRISCDDPPFPEKKWSNISYEALDFVRKLLQKDPSKRLSAKDALSHLWLRELDNGKTSAQEQQTSPTSGISESNTALPDDKAKEKREEQKVSSPKSRLSSSSIIRHGNETSQVPPPKEQLPAIKQSRSISSDRAKNKSRAVSSDDQRTSTSPENTTSTTTTTTTTSRGVPPPPPKPQAQTGRGEKDGCGSAVANQILQTVGNSADDVNARLLDVIKDQDAKIEKLERLVRQMLEPEGTKRER